MEQIPILQCATKYPEVGTFGICEPVFDSILWQTPFKTLNGEEQASPSLSFSLSPNDKQSVKEAFMRKQNLAPAIRRTKKVDLTNSSQIIKAGFSKYDMDIENVLALLKNSSPKGSIFTTTNKSTQIDFSESLLDLCDDLTPIILQDQTEFDEPFEYGQAELRELIEFDLPDILPGIDRRRLGLIDTDVKNTFTMTSALSGENIESSTIYDTSSQLELEITPTTSNLSNRLVQEKHIDVTTSAFDAHAQQQDIAKSRSKGDQLQSLLPTTPIVFKDGFSPPPPPPPPPPALTAAKNSQKPQSDGHADLMAAIRATGGIKGAGLKKIEASTEKNTDDLEQSSSKTASASQPEDLMSSLARVLALRRKGISGKQKQTSATRTAANATLADSLRERIPTRKRTGSSGGEQQYNDQLQNNNDPDWDEDQ